jgi:surfeit locus 1 family protein
VIGKLPIIPTLVVLAAVAVMVRLGFWQLDRLEEKEALLARYEAAADDTRILSAFPSEPLDNLYRRTPFTCSEVTSWRAVAGRSNSDASGFAHVAQCPEGNVVIGWSQTPQEPEWQGGEVTGTIGPSVESGWRVIADPPLAGLEPNAALDPNDIPNNHLAYAVQWFFFALTALVIYALALRRRWR